MLNDRQFERPQDEHNQNAAMGQLPLGTALGASAKRADMPLYYDQEALSHWGGEVGAFRNLNTPRIGRGKDEVVYSVVAEGLPTGTGKKAERTIGYTDDITLNDATATVGSAGRAEVVRTGRKNVHAKIHGTPDPTPMGHSKNDSALYYKPDDARIPDNFVDAPVLFGKGEVVPVEKAKRVRLSSKGGKPNVRYR